jgi:hypothetical protein
MHRNWLKSQYLPQVRPLIRKSFLFFALFFARPVWSSIPDQEIDQGVEQDFSDQVSEVHQSVSERILSISDSIDWFLTDEEQSRKNKTRVKLSFMSSKMESSDIENDFNFKVSLRLPNFQNKLKLTFENEAEEDNKVIRQQGRLKTERGSRGARSSLSLWMKEVMNFRVKLTTGVKLKFPPQIFGKLKLNRIDHIGKWRVQFAPTFLWSSEEGYGEYTSLYFDREISKWMLFRFSNEQNWYDDTDELKTSHGPSLIHQLSEKRVISYNFRANFTNRPTFEIENYNFNIGYRQNLKKNWFFYHFIPQMDFAKDNDFKMRLGATIKISLIFGYH